MDRGSAQDRGSQRGPGIGGGTSDTGQALGGTGGGACGGSGGGAWNNGCSAGTVCASCQPAMPAAHTSVVGVTCPACTPAWICATEYGPLGVPARVDVELLPGAG